MYTSRIQTKKEERENSYDTKALGFKLQLFLPTSFLNTPLGLLFQVAQSTSDISASIPKVLK